MAKKGQVAIYVEIVMSTLLPSFLVSTLNLSSIIAFVKRYMHVKLERASLRSTQKEGNKVDIKLWRIVFLTLRSNSLFVKNTELKKKQPSVDFVQMKKNG